MRKRIEWIWEKIHANENSETLRVKVIGGWIVQTTLSDAKRVATSSVFVSDRDHEWNILPPVKAEEAKPTVKSADFEPKWNILPPVKAEEAKPTVKSADFEPK